MMVVDELINGTLSEMIERIREGILKAGDYKFYLTELVIINKRIRDRSIETGKF
jgi:hypothetical protein